eukprot:scaffold12444_cov134-Skeletonema_marinoi.AAC.6
MKQQMTQQQLDTIEEEQDGSMSVRFDQVEVIEMRQYNNTSVTVQTKNIYTLDTFELMRKSERRSMKQFHRSDLYREEIWLFKQKNPSLPNNNPSPVIKKTVETDDITSPSLIDRLAMGRIKKRADDSKKSQRQRRKRLFQKQNQNSLLKSSLMPIRESVSIAF